MSDLGPIMPSSTQLDAPVNGGVQIVLPHGSVEDLLLEKGQQFDFFQAVRLLERLAPTRRPVGRQGSPAAEVVRFRTSQSLSFPASSIQEILPPTTKSPLPLMTVNFFGLTGPSGVLPRHYTELLIRRNLYFRGAERYALRDWLDLFNHRLISLFYRAWEKYRFWIAYERGLHEHSAPDTFTTCLFSLIGLGMPTLRNRLRVSLGIVPETSVVDRSAIQRSDRGAISDYTTGNERQPRREQVLAQVEDLALLRYAGILSQQPRSAANLEALLADYFHVPVIVQQFQGQWLQLERDNQSRLDGNHQTACLGENLVVGRRVWDVQGKIRIRLGPLRYAQFCEFFPDRSPRPKRKALFLLAHLVRLFVGPELDFDVQLVLHHEDVPPTQLSADAEIGPRLGWSTWIQSTPSQRDAEDATINGEEVRWVSSTTEAGIN